MTGRYDLPKTWEITASIFDEMDADTPKNFRERVTQHYRHLFAQGSYHPVIQDKRLDDAWKAFRHDKKHLLDSLHSESNNQPDHFKLSGILAYWLRRFAPVYDLEERVNYRMRGEAPDSWKKLMEDYSSELAAFDLGLYICSGFEAGKQKNPSDVPDIDENDFDYYKDVCFLLKRKNLSPHSLGMIYRSLFVPLREKKETDLVATEAEDSFANYSVSGSKPSGKKE